MTFDLDAKLREIGLRHPERINDFTRIEVDRLIASAQSAQREQAAEQCDLAVRWCQARLLTAEGYGETPEKLAWALSADRFRRTAAAIRGQSGGEKP